MLKLLNCVKLFNVKHLGQNLIDYYSIIQINFLIIIFKFLKYEFKTIENIHYDNSFVKGEIKIVRKNYIIENIEKYNNSD